MMMILARKLTLCNVRRGKLSCVLTSWRGFDEEKPEYSRMSYPFLVKARRKSMTTISDDIEGDIETRRYVI